MPNIEKEHFNTLGNIYININADNLTIVKVTVNGNARLFFWFNDLTVTLTPFWPLTINGNATQIMVNDAQVCPSVWSDGFFHGQG